MDLSKRRAEHTYSARYAKIQDTDFNDSDYYESLDS